MFLLKKELQSHQVHHLDRACLTGYRSNWLPITSLPTNTHWSLPGLDGRKNHGFTRLNKAAEHHGPAFVYFLTPKPSLLLVAVPSCFDPVIHGWKVLLCSHVVVRVRIVQIFKSLAGATAILPHWIHVCTIAHWTREQIGVSISLAFSWGWHESCMGLLCHGHLRLLLQLEASLRPCTHQALQKFIPIHSFHEGVRAQPLWAPSTSRYWPIKGLDMTEVAPRRWETLVLVAQMVLGPGLRGKLIPLVLQVEEWLGLWLAHHRCLGDWIQALQVPHGELGEGVILAAAVLLQSLGESRSTVWLLLSAVRTWHIAHGTRRVYGDCVHWECCVGICPWIADL